MISNSIENSEGKKENPDEYLNVENVYGLNQFCKNSLGFLTNTECIYLTGSNLFKFDIENYKQKLIRIRSRGKFQCMNISSNKRYVLFLNLEQDASQLILIDLKQESLKNNIKCKRRIQNTIINCIAISVNMELVVCQSDSESNWNLSVYSFMHLKKLAEIQPISSLYSNEQTVEEISFLPNENKKFILIGHKLIKIFQYVNINRIKLVCNIECMFYLEKHCWFNKTDLITYDKYSNFFIIDPKQGLIKPIIFLNKNSLSLSNSTCNFEDEESEKNNLIYLINIKRKLKLTPTIVCVTDGFILSNLNDFVLYYKHDSLNNFNLTYLIRLQKTKFKEFISNIYSNDSKTVLIALTSRNNICCFRFKNLSLSRPNEFDVLIESYHFDSITSIDACVRKTWIATCSLDRTITIWNYETKTVDLKQHFEQDLLTVAFHPSGLYLIVCTTNWLQYMKICLNSLEVLHSISVRNCTNCVFTNGGHMFAFVQGTIVSIYSSIKLVELNSIKAQDLGKIKQLRFTSNDYYLMCCSMAGIIKVWAINLPNIPVSNEIITKGLSYVGLALHPLQDKLYLISTEKAIREYELPLNEELKQIYKSNTPAKLTRKLETNQAENLTCIEISKSGELLLAGTNKGFLKVFLLSTGYCKEYRAHASSLNRICIGYNDELVVTGSDDGTIVFWQICSDLRLKSISNDYIVNNKTQYTSLITEQEIVLTNKTEYLEKSKKICEIQHKIDAINSETELQLRLRELKFKIKTRDLNIRFDNQKNQLKQQINMILLDQEKYALKFDSDFETKLIHYLKNIQDLHDNLNSKIENEKKKNTELSLKISELEQEIKSNLTRVNQIKNDTLLKQYEKVEIYLKLTQNNHLKEMKILDNEINNLIDYEVLFEEELEQEKNEINSTNKLQVLEAKIQNEHLQQELEKLLNDLKIQQKYLVDTRKESEKKNKDYFNYMNKLKELDELDLSLKQELEIKKENFLDNRKMNELEIGIHELEEINNSLDCFIQKEIKLKLRPLKEHNQEIKMCIGEIKSEIKENKTNIFKIKNEIESNKNIYRVKQNEINYLNKATREKNLVCKQLIDYIKTISNEAQSKINENCKHHN